MKIAILGSGGQLGKALVKSYPAADAFGHSDLDISDSKQIESIDWKKYDVIINAAAYVNADHSETAEGRALAWKTNAIGPRNLSEIATKHGKHLIHISSEYVFDGTHSNHDEEEPFTPLSAYGQSKSAGDIAVSLTPKHHILRTSWVVGEGHNFVKTMKSLADMRIDPKVVDDQFGRLTFTSELVRAIDFIVNNDVAYGTYNLSNSGAIKSWAQIAAEVFVLAGHDMSRVTPISTEEYSHEKVPFAPRPEHSDMSLSKIQNAGFESQDYEPLLREYVESLGA